MAEGAKASPGLITKLGETTSKIAGRLVPDPFVLAVILSLLTLILALFTGQAVQSLPLSARLPKIVIDGWYGGLFGSGGLAFSFQMVLVLVTGHALALSPPVQKMINAIALAPRSAAQASAVVAFTACASAFIHWGLGAVAGAMLAREIGRAWYKHDKPLHYPLLGAAAYSGLLVWHGGFSGTASLKVSEPGHFLMDVTGVIPTSQTLLSLTNFLITGSLFLLCTLLYFFLTPRDASRMQSFDPAVHGADLEVADHNAAEGGHQHPLVHLLENGPIIPWIFALFALGTIGHAFYQKGGDALDLNLVNLIFFALGLLFHQAPKTYGRAAAEGARGAVGIVLQFPLYFGIMGMLKASGLIVQLSDFFVEISTQNTLPVFVFLSAGLVNLFVPSGGGQWAVQGPIMMNAAKTLGVDPAKAVLALSYGDAWTNMLQPFWALPLLGITGLKARDIIGYTTLIFLAAGPLVILWLVIL